MVDLATVYEKVQLGIEVTPGTGVAATKIVSATAIGGNPQATINRYRPSGYKFNTIHARGREWTEAPMAGPMTYTEMLYWLSSAFSTAVITTPTNGVKTRLWTFGVNSSAADTYKTYTVEVGSSVRGRKFTNGFVNSFGFNVSREEASLSGTMLGTAIQDDVAPTVLTSAAEIPLMPMLPEHFSVYVADTQAGLTGASAMTRAFGFGFNLSDKLRMLWPVNRAKTSFDGLVERAYDIGGELTVMADDAGYGAFLTAMRAGTSKFIRIEAQGASIESVTPEYFWKFQLDLATKISEPGGFDDDDGLVQTTWALGGVHDSTWGKAVEARMWVDNTVMSAL